MTCAADGAALWDVASGVELHRFRGHRQPISCVAFHPSGWIVAIGSEDGTVRFWDCSTGEELVQLDGLDRGANWIAATGEGLFEGSKEGREKVSYRIGADNQERVDPMERFIRRSYYPGLGACPRIRNRNPQVLATKQLASFEPN